MDTILNAATIDTLWTLCAGVLVLSGGAITLWALPWSDQDIRATDKALNPIDLTQECIASPTLSRA
ncbi:MAG: hypothetical protein ACPGTU_18815 [Myxococcota bacterium]